jgi:hypothetical protein
MKTLLVIPFFVLTLLISCESSTKKIQDKNTVSHIDTLQQDTSKPRNPIEETLNTIPKNIKPVLGYRFILSGDFDGDGKKEKLIEHFYSGLDNKETNKFYDSLSNYDQLVVLTIKKSPFHL